MSAQYFWTTYGDRERVEFYSNTIHNGILVSGPGGFPPCLSGGMRWLSAAEWLAWAGPDAYWESLDEYADVE